MAERSNHPEVWGFAVRNWARMAGAIAISAVIGGVLYAVNGHKRSEVEQGGWVDLSLEPEPHSPTELPKPDAA